MRLFRPIRKNNEGAAIIEFAIVAPALFLVLVGFIELGLILFTTSVLEGATNVGARIGSTGYTTQNLDRSAYIINQINSLSGGFLNPALLQVSIASYTGFSVIGNPANSTGTTGGYGGNVVVYTVTYPWTLFTPLMGNLLGTGGVYTITAVALVRNEQF